MKDKNPTQKRVQTDLARQASGRPCLRLISCDTQKDAHGVESPGKRNSFVRFMTAYADAIDREVQAILDL